MLKPPFKVVALYPFTSDIEDDLHFEANQEIEVEAIEDEDWYSGNYIGSDGIVNTGMFPKNFVKVLEPEPVPAVPIPARPALKKVDEFTDDTNEKSVESTPKSPGNDEGHTIQNSANAEPARKNGLLGRISTFNHETSVPLNPDSKPKEESFVKKPFYNPQSSYVPPSYNKTPVKKEEPTHVPPPVNSSSTPPAHEDHSPTEEEGPKLSLKERIALLQKRQQEEAEREAELERRRLEKKELKKKKKAELHTHSTAEGELSHEQPPVPLTSNTTGGSLLSSLSHGDKLTRHSTHTENLTDDNTSLYQDADNEIAEHRASTGGDLQSLAEQDSEEDNEEYEGLDEESGDEENEKDDDDDDDDDDEDDDDDDEDDEEDEEEARKRALRERMAKLSGGVGMFGMMGMASPFAATTAKPKKSKTENKELNSSEPIPPPQPLPGFAIPSLPKELVKADENQISSESNNPKPIDREIHNDDDDESVSSTVHGLSSEDNEEDVAVSATNITDEEEDTVNEELLVAPVVPITPIVAATQRKAEIRDHSFEHDEEDDHETEIFKDAETSPELRLPGDPLSSVIELNTTGYDADEDTDLPPPLPSLPPVEASSIPASEIPTSRAPTIPHVETPTTGAPPIPHADIPTTRAPPIPHANIPTTRAPPIPHADIPTTAPPIPHADIPTTIPPIPHSESPVTRAPPIPHAEVPSSRAPPIPQFTEAASTPPVPAIPPHAPSSLSHPSLLPERLNADLPPPIPNVPAPISKAQSKTFSGHQGHHDNIAPVRRSSTHRDKEAPPPPPLSSVTTPSKLGSKKSVDLSRRSMEGISRPNTLNSEVGHVNIDLSVDNEWWVHSEVPPAIASEIGKNAIFEVDTHSIQKRGGRNVIYRDYYVLYHDLSQLVIEVNYSASDPASTVSFKQYEIKSPTPRKDKLDELSFEYGTQVLKLAESLGAANIGANRLVPYVLGKLSKRLPILPAIGTKGYGALVLKFNSFEDYTKYDEVRPGDILCMKAKFINHNKLRQKSVIDVGVGEVHSCIIYEYEPAKQKFKVIETDAAGKITRGSYKLGDFKSGKLRVFRVVGRDYINWV